MILLQVVHELSTELLQFHTIYALPPIVIPLIIMGVQLGATVFKGIKANKEKKAALAAIENYEIKARPNVYKDKPWFNEQARQFAKDERNLNQAESIAASRFGGARTYAGVDKAQRQADKATLEQSIVEQDAFITHQDKVAQDDARLQALTVAEERADISGLASLYEASRQDESNAITESGQAIASGAAAYNSNIDYTA